MTLAEVLAAHRLEVDWTDEEVACSCGWSDHTFTGKPPEHEWQGHFKDVLQREGLLE